MTIQEIVAQAAKEQASDVYIKANAVPLLRVSDKLIPIHEKRLSDEEVLQIAHSMMNEEQIKEFRENLEFNFAYYSGDSGRFRVNIYKQRGCIALVMRRVRMKIPSMESLKLPSVLKNLAMEERGLILVTGATGSGKSTTLASMIDYRNTNRQGHIITIEDPIEFMHPDKQSIISQREVGTDTHSFHEALKNALRQTPDVILIGEMRDVESVTAAINFAETGHLVLSTLHAPNSNQAIERIMQFFPHEMHEQIYQQLSFNLRAIISQRLIPVKDGEGRVPAVEVMQVSPRIKDLIQKMEIGKIKGAMEASTQDGMQSFDQSVYDLYTQGLITQEDALANADSSNDLRLRMRGLTMGA